MRVRVSVVWLKVGGWGKVWVWVRVMLGLGLG